MALLNDAFSSLGGAVMIGIGAALVAPVLLPAAGAILRPVAKGVIKGGFYLVDTLQEVIAEGGEQLSDLMAEVQAERATSVATTTQTKQQ